MVDQTIDTTPLDAKELQPCTCCGKGVMHDGTPVFYELTMRSCVVDLNSVRQLHGLETMMGSAPLARVFAPSTNVAHRVGEAARPLICAECAAEPEMPLRFIEGDESEVDRG